VRCRAVVERRSSSVAGTASTISNTTILFIWLLLKVSTVGMEPVSPPNCAHRSSTWAWAPVRPLALPAFAAYSAMVIPDTTIGLGPWRGNRRAARGPCSSPAGLVRMALMGRPGRVLAMGGPVQHSSRHGAHRS